jgi:cytoskeletal protein CcmA (bactofilin family)
MKKESSPVVKEEVKASSSEPPVPEVLHAQADEQPAEPEASSALAKPKPHTPLHRVTYRPSHKATFIGLGVVVVVLAINAVIITFVVQGQSTASASGSQADVTISPAVLNTLGVSRNAVGNSGTQLVVGPDSQFNGKLTVASDVSIGGALKLNGSLSVADASLTSLQAGTTSLGSLNVNGDTTASNLNLRQNLTVAGSSSLQGTVTIGQLLTVNNSVNVAGNLAVGGLLSARSFESTALTSDTTLTIGGHIITRGSAPGVSAGGAVGSNGTVSISGNDASGTVAVNIGVGAVSGLLATISFHAQFSNTPHVVITSVGRDAGDVYINRTSTGFSIYTSSNLSPGGYAFDYIVMQ